MIALDVETLSSFCVTHLFEVSALKMLTVCFALMTVRFILIYCENVSFGSKLFPRVFGCFVVGCI